MRKLLVLSYILTIILIFAQIFRWDTIESINSDGTLYIYKEDNWVNQKWVEIYEDTFYEMLPVPSDHNYEEAYQLKEFLSQVWGILLFFSLLTNIMLFSYNNSKTTLFIPKIRLIRKQYMKKATN